MLTSFMSLPLLRSIVHLATQRYHRIRLRSSYFFGLTLLVVVSWTGTPITVGMSRVKRAWGDIWRFGIMVLWCRYNPHRD